MVAHINSLAVQSAMQPPSVHTGTSAKVINWISTHAWDITQAAMGMGQHLFSIIMKHKIAFFVAIAAVYLMNQYRQPQQLDLPVSLDSHTGVGNSSNMGQLPLTTPNETNKSGNPNLIQTEDDKQIEDDNCSDVTVPDLFGLPCEPQPGHKRTKVEPKPSQNITEEDLNLRLGMSNLLTILDNSNFRSMVNDEW